MYLKGCGVLGMMDYWHLRWMMRNLCVSMWFRVLPWLCVLCVLCGEKRLSRVVAWEHIVRQIYMVIF